MPIVALCRRHGFSEASFYLWRNKFGGMSVSDAKRLKELEGENTRLKRLLANAMLNTEGLVLPLTENLGVPVNPSANTRGHGERSVGNPVVDRTLRDRQKLGSGFFGDEFVGSVHR